MTPDAGADSVFEIVARDALPNDGNTYEFEGLRYGETGVSFIWVDMAPGGGVRLHKHPYQEIFIIHEGVATFTVGAAAEVEARAGQIVIAPAGTPHKFRNSGEQRLRQVDIHVSSQFVTEWLEE